MRTRRLRIDLQLGGEPHRDPGCRHIVKNGHKEQGHEVVSRRDGGSPWTKRVSAERCRSVVREAGGIHECVLSDAEVEVKDGADEDA